MFSLVLFPLISSPSFIFLFSVFLFYTFPLPFSSPPFHSFSFLSILVFSYFPVSCLLSTFPLFIFPPSMFLLPSFLSPFFYSHYCLVCPNFIFRPLYTSSFPSVFIVASYIPRILYSFCYSSCSMWKTGSWECGYFSLPFSCVIYDPFAWEKNLWDRADPCRSGSCGGACLSSSVCFEDIKWGSVFKLCTAKFTTWVTAACPLLCKLNLEDVCFLNLIHVTSLQRTLADRVLCVPCLTLLVDQQGTVRDLS